MPKVLDLETTEGIEVEAEALEEESWRLGPTDGVSDLSDGGVVNGVRVRPARDKNVTKGRPVAWRAWMANGTETLLPLAWDPEGLNHDSAARYFRKRLCLCCQYAGFKAPRCPACVKKDCSRCHGRADSKKIIPCFYRRREDAPFAVLMYGSIPCFLGHCIRRGDRGFLTEVDMRLHARNRHKLEYQAYTESLAGSKTDEVADLRKRVDELVAIMLKAPVPVVATVEEAPLYVSDKPTQPKPRRTRRSKSIQ